MLIKTNFRLETFFFSAFSVFKNQQLKQSKKQRCFFFKRKKKSEKKNNKKILKGFKKERKICLTFD